MLGTRDRPGHRQSVTVVIVQASNHHQIGPEFLKRLEYPSDFEFGPELCRSKVLEYDPIWNIHKREPHWRLCAARESERWCHCLQNREGYESSCAFQEGAPGKLFSIQNRRQPSPRRC